MTGPGGGEVAKVSIRVVPDTSRFASDLKRELQKVKDLKVKIPVEFDIDRDSLKKQIQDIRVPKARIPVDVDTGAGTANVERFVRQTAARRPSVKVVTDLEQASFDKMIAEFQKGVKVKAEADEAALKASLAKVKLDMKVKAEADEASLKASLARVNARMKVLAEIDKAAVERNLRNLDAQAQIDVDMAHFREQVARAAAAAENVGRVKVQVDLDRSALTRVSNAIRDTVGRTFSGIGSIAATAIGGAVTAGRALSDVWSGVSSAVGGAAGFLLKFSAISAGLAVGGAAISAAWGGVSTAIAAVPAALGLIGAPLGAVALGMDGIKRAAKALEPEFNRLKATVSATFETGLRPVFAQLKGSMDALAPSISRVATSLVGLAQQTANWVTQSGGLRLIQTMFDNVATALAKINLAPLIEGFVRLAGNEAALQALAATINQVGLALFSISQNPALNQAFAGLEAVLISVTNAFEGLVNNGIKLFAAAAPGIRSAIDSITNFFSRFDWNSLGTSVGNVFRGIADAIKGIPPGTVTAIEQAFARLAAVFQSPEFQQGVRDFAALLPDAIDAIGRGASAFGQIVTAIRNVLIELRKLDLAWQETLLSIGVGSEQAVNDARARLNNTLGIIPGEMDAQLKKIHPVFTENFGALPPIAGQAGTATANEFVGKLAPIAPQTGGILSGLPQFMARDVEPLPGIAGSAGQGVTREFTGGLSPIVPQAGGILSGLGPAVMGPLAPLPAQVGGVGQQIPPALVDPITGLPAQMGTLGGQIGSGLLGPLGQLPGQVNQAGELVVGGFGSGIQGLSPALQQELGLLPPVATTGMGQVGTALTTGLAALPPQVQAALVPLQTAFTTGLALITTGISTTFGPQLSTAITTALATVGPAVTAALLPVQTAFTAGLTAITTSISTTFGPQMTTALTTAFQAVVAAIPTVFTAPLQTAFTTAFTTIFAAFPTIFTLPFTTAFTTAVQAIIAQVPTLFTLPLQTAFTTAFTTIFALFPTIFTLPFQTALTTAMTTISALVPTLFVPINTAFTTAFAAIVALIPVQLDQPMTQAVTTAMTNFNNAVRTGFTTVNSSVTAGLNAIIQNLNRLPPAGTTTGRNLITAMSNAILAGRSQLINAIAQVIAAAIAAATSILQINSPSKVFQGIGLSIPEGMAKGVTDNASMVTSAVKAMTDDAVVAGRSMSDILANSVAFDPAAMHSRVAASGQLNQAGPTVNVFVGDEQLDARTDYRIGLYDADMRGSLAVRRR